MISASSILLLLPLFISFSCIQSGQTGWGTSIWSRYDREANQRKKFENDMVRSCAIGVGNAFAIKKSIDWKAQYPQRTYGLIKMTILINCFNIFYKKEKIPERFGATLFGMTIPFWA